MLRRRIIDANKGRSVVPVLRYFVVMGCCLLGLLFGIDYLVPKEAVPAKAEATKVSDGGSLASWRHSQERLDKPQAAAAVVYPATAAEAIAPPPHPVKSVAKTPSRPRTVARAERHDRPNYAAAYPPAPISQYSGYRQAQFDRPYGGYGGGFFGFRMF